jgi:hypothetical protein
LQVRKLLQSLTAEIAANRRANFKAAKEKERETDDYDLVAGKVREKKKVGVTSLGEKVEKEKEKDEQEDWVQCDLCSKWRRLPKQSHPNYPTDLPDSWICSMNTWDKISSCSKPEDSFTVKELSAGAIKIRIWARRLKAADKYEAKFNRARGNPAHSMSSIVTGSVDRDFGDVDWVRCCNP